MPEKVRAFECCWAVIHKGIQRRSKAACGYAALVLLLEEPDEPDEFEEPEEFEEDELFDESEDFDPEEEEESEDDEEEDDESLLAGIVLVPEERLSLR